jgi:hypothetical protein
MAFDLWASGGRGKLSRGTARGSGAGAERENSSLATVKLRSGRGWESGAANVKAHTRDCFFSK